MPWPVPSQAQDTLIVEKQTMMQFHILRVPNDIAPSTRVLPLRILVPPIEAT